MRCVCVRVRRSTRVFGLQLSAFDAVVLGGVGLSTCVWSTTTNHVCLRLRSAYALHWHVTGARRAKGHGAAAPTMHTCRLPCPPALQPHGKCENGLRSGSYVLAAASWPRQIVQDMRACRWRATRGANHGDLQAAVPTRLATAWQLRKRFYGLNRM